MVCLDEKRLAEQIGISRSMIKKMRREGWGLPYVRVGSRIVYMLRDVELYLEQNTVKPQAEAEGEAR